MYPNRRRLIIFAALVGPVLLSLWAGPESRATGPSRLVAGPDRSVYVLVGSRVLRLSAAGGLLGEIDLGTDIVADIAVAPDGSVLDPIWDDPLHDANSGETYVFRFNPADQLELYHVIGEAEIEPRPFATLTRVKDR